MFRAITSLLRNSESNGLLRHSVQIRNLSLTQALSQRNTENDSSNSDRSYSSDDPKLEKTINQITLLGRVGSTPTKRGSSDHPVVVFSLATQSNYQYSSGDVSQKAEWHRICVFKPYLRETAFKYVTKGQRILVMGRLIYGDVKDSEGNSRQVASIVADDIVSFRPYD
nr:EOG090X0O5J [Triops cancriformis]